MSFVRSVNQMDKIKIITDSSSGISQAESKKLGIDVIPMPLVIDNQEYLDGITMFYEDAVTLLQEKKVFKTAQPLPKDLLATWDKALEEYDYVVYIPLSSGLSGSCVNAYTLSQSYDGRVVVVDAKAVESPLRYVCLEAKKLADHGYSAIQIKETLEANFKSTYACIVPESVEPLKRGGRITPAAAAVAGLLKIQPILKIEYGNVDLHSKVRTLKKAYQEAMLAVRDQAPKEELYWLFLSIGFSKEEEAKLIAQFQDIVGQEEILADHFTPIIAAHTGNRTVGIGYTKKYKVD